MQKRTAKTHGKNAVQKRTCQQTFIVLPFSRYRNPFKPQDELTVAKTGESGDIYSNNRRVKPGNANWRERLSAVDLLTMLARLAYNVKKFFNAK